MEVSDFLNGEINDTIEIIRKRAAAYVAEWNFDIEQPDMGTTLAILFANMMEDTIKQFSKLPSNYRIQFYNMLGANQLPSGEAKGFVTFSTVNDEVQGSWIKTGERLLGETEGGEPVIFETQDEVYVSSARLKSVYYVDGRRDYISMPFEFPMRIRQKENQQSHIFYISHDILFCIKTEGEIILDFGCSKSIYEKEQENVLMNQIVWSYYSKEGFVKFPDSHYEEGKIYLKKERTMPAFERMEGLGQDSFWLRMEIKNLKPESRIVFQGLSLSSSGSFIMPEIIYDGNMELDNESFFSLWRASVSLRGNIFFFGRSVFKKGCFNKDGFWTGFFRISGRSEISGNSCEMA